MLILSWSFFSPSVVAEGISLEYKVKAGYLYNFTKFINWQPVDSDHFRLCIVGDDPFGNLIQPIENKNVLGKAIRLFRYSRLDQSLSDCQMVFFAHSSYYLDLQSNRFKNILTVGEGESFMTQGGMLAFVLKENRVKLQINPYLIKKRGLTVSAKLLEVSEIIGESDE